MKLLILPFTGRSLSYHRFMSKIVLLFCLYFFCFWKSENDNCCHVFFSILKFISFEIWFPDQTRISASGNKSKHYFDETSLHWPIGIWQGNEIRRRRKRKIWTYRLYVEIGCVFRSIRFQSFDLGCNFFVGVHEMWIAECDRETVVAFGDVKQTGWQTIAYL